MKFTPFICALTIGKSHTDILHWINSGELHANKIGKYIEISADDLASYFYHNPENVGRIYCHDMPQYINKMRDHIVNKLEELYNEH